MTRAQRITGWLVGWMLAMLAGETLGLLLAAGLWVKSTTVAEVVLGGTVVVAFCVAPFAATSLLRQLLAVAGEYDRMWQHVNGMLGRDGGADVSGPR